MRELHVIVSNKIATYLRRDGNIICGNNDYMIVFSFDSEWDGHDAKVARFIWNGKYLDVAFSGNTVTVPILTKTTLLEVGVYAGELSTTTPAEIDCAESILCEHGMDEEAQHQENNGKIEYRLPLAGEKDEGKILTVEGGAYVLKITEEEAMKKQIADLEKEVADLKYKEIAISNFSASPSTAEMGSTINSVILSWGTNKKPTALTLDGASVDVTATSKTVTSAVTSNKTWALKATDERGAEATKTAALSFLNGVYYGVSNLTSITDSNGVLASFRDALTKKLRSGKLTSFSVNAGEGEYIYYLLPKRMGACSFNVGGFDGGFSLIDTVNLTNASGYTEEYYIYRSDNAGLGQTAVSVS